MVGDLLSNNFRSYHYEIDYLGLSDPIKLCKQCESAEKSIKIYDFES